MRILKILKVNESRPSRPVYTLCPDCTGSGFNWSTLEFGDIPGDEVKVPCDLCNKTGRIKTVEVVANIQVPFDYKFEEPKVSDE